ncbi:MAG: Mbeg1-like protein, partial [Acutalibacteraceae bacterium]
MSCLVDYVLNFGGQSFSEKPFNEVDNLIFSLLSYFNFAGKVTGTDSPKKKVTLFDVLYNNSDATVYKDIFNQERIKELIPLLIISRRFGRVELCCYSSETDEEKQVQFSATTFILDDNSVYVAFRGTDMSFVGWKEDFNMSFIYPVPAQIQAQSYLELIARS